MAVPRRTAQFAMNKKIKSLVLAACLFAPAAYAQVFLHATTDNGSGRPGFSNQPLSVGSFFEVLNDGIMITSVGAYSGASPFGGGLAGSLSVTIYSASGAVVPTTTLNSGNTEFIQGYYYTEVAPTFLPAGSYAISVSGYTSNKGDFFVQSGAGQAPSYSTFNVTHLSDVTFAANNHNFFNGSSTMTPTALYGKTGSFGYTPVPEPETYAAIVGLGLIGFALWRRKPSYAV